MVLKQREDFVQCFIEFENDVKMYGTQTQNLCRTENQRFENDVKMYGTQTKRLKLVCVSLV